MTVKKKLYSTEERSREFGIHSIKKEEFAIIELLSRDYDIKLRQII